MPPLTRLYTRTGDKGATRLGGGQSVEKCSLRLECYGTVDELNSVLGLAIAFGPCSTLSEPLHRLQHELFILGSDLCFLEDDKRKWAVPAIQSRHVDALEAEIDSFQDASGRLENFILPGGNTVAAQLHVARTVCRRAERLLVQLGHQEPTSDNSLRYLNRLSDWLFAAARIENRERSISEPLWDATR